MGNDKTIEFVNICKYKQVKKGAAVRLRLLYSLIFIRVLQVQSFLHGSYTGDR